jgi:outer membrane protein assembly factor BamB
MSCLRADTGKVVWRKDFSSEFRIPMPICGASLSPVIDGKKIFVHVGHDDKGAFLALDKETGKEIWAWQGEGPGYTSPVIATIGGIRQIITASHNMWIGLNSENGLLLWKLPVRQNMFNHNSITPVVVGDIVICGANQRPTFALKIKRSGDSWSTEKLWETREVTMSTSSPVISGSSVYAFNEKRRGQIARMSLDSGSVEWTCPGNKGENTTLYVTGKNMLAFTSSGELFVYENQAKAPVEVVKYQLTDSSTWASPALSGNRILVKGADTLTLWEIPTR